MNLDRAEAPNPYDLLPPVPSFTVTSDAFTDGGEVPRKHALDGSNVSPQLSWHGAPEGTRGYAVTCFDPDAPTPSGFWHWTVLRIPAGVTELAENAGAEGGANLPEGAFHVVNDYGTKAFGRLCPAAGRPAAPLLLRRARPRHRRHGDRRLGDGNGGRVQHRDAHAGPRPGQRQVPEPLTLRRGRSSLSS